MLVDCILDFAGSICSGLEKLILVSVEGRNEMCASDVEYFIGYLEDQESI